MKPYKTSRGNWQLNYTLSGRQHTLSLGRGYTATAAERTAKIVSELVLLRKIGESPPTDLLHRVSNLPVRVQSSLERGGLILCCFGLSIGECGTDILRRLEPRRCFTRIAPATS